MRPSTRVPLGRRRSRVSLKGANLHRRQQAEMQGLELFAKFILFVIFNDVQDLNFGKLEILRFARDDTFVKIGVLQ